MVSLSDLPYVELFWDLIQHAQIDEEA